MLGAAAINTAAAAPDSAVPASQRRLLRLASAMAPTIGESTAAMSIDTEIQAGKSTAPVASSGATTFCT